MLSLELAACGKMENGKRLPTVFHFFSIDQVQSRPPKATKTIKQNNKIHKNPLTSIITCKFLIVGQNKVVALRIYKATTCSFAKLQLLMIRRLA